MELTANHITLRGALTGIPQFSHENHGRRFFRFSLEVPRLSGTVDILPVIAQEEVLNAMELSDGEMLTVTGQVRSHNVREEGKRRLLIFVFAGAIVCEDGAPLNEVVLQGPLCREPTYRRTPLGREICDVMLAVPRAFHRADYLPCILWGRTALECSRYHTRDILRITGRLQSRVYTKVTDTGSEERTAYEISALNAQWVPPEPEGGCPEQNS
ncbi:MAG: single-stranded DNA-binding protein [Faecousia sp.]